MKPLKSYIPAIKDSLRRYWYLYLTALVTVIAALGTYIFINSTLKKPVPGTPNKPPVVNVKPPESTKPKITLTCPLDGMPLAELPARRVLAASIDNSSQAIPQSGLKDADLVMEMPVEGGITRLLAFYYHNQAARIGPIRSARPYLVAKAQEYGAVIIHSGQSPQTQTYFKQTRAEHIDEMPATPGFWREKSRKQPHNLYTSSMNMWNNLQTAGLAGNKTLNGLKYAENAVLPNAQESPKLTIFYPYGEVTYQYQPVDKDYLRFISGKAHIDAESFLPLRIKNIIIQYVNTKVLDGEGRLALDLDAKGRAVVTTGGKTLEATWEKQPSGTTKYFDAQGNEITLPPGQTWIEIVQSNMEIDY